MWNGRRLLPEGWVRYATTPTPRAPAGSYGAHWWLNAGEPSAPERRPWPALPVETWAARNGCDPTPIDTVITPEVTHRVYDCPKDAAVEFYILPGSGHVWPGSEFSRAIEAAVGYTTFDIHATEAAWAFFERFDL